MYICLCNGITERDIRAHAQDADCSLADLERCLGVGAGCGRCKRAAAEVLSERHSGADSPFSAATA
jgi:bacterioferritin-associated ferredoxin